MGRNFVKIFGMMVSAGIQREIFMRKVPFFVVVLCLFGAIPSE